MAKNRNYEKPSPSEEILSEDGDEVIDVSTVDEVVINEDQTTITEEHHSSENSNVAGKYRVVFINTATHKRLHAIVTASSALDAKNQIAEKSYNVVLSVKSCGDTDG